MVMGAPAGSANLFKSEAKETDDHGTHHTGFLAPRLAETRFSVEEGLAPNPNLGSDKALDLLQVSAHLGNLHWAISVSTCTEQSRIL